MPSTEEKGPGLEKQSARTMTLDDITLVHPYHVLDVHWEGNSPVMTFRPLEERGGRMHYDGRVLRTDLSRLDALELRASGNVQCVGRFEGGEHIPCPGNDVLEGFAQCYPCISHDIPDPSCIFEPHCDKDRCGADFCQVPHVVYVAMFRRRPKVGMTQLRRVVERGTEQGADMILPLVVTRDRWGSRMVEKNISKRYRTPQALNPAAVLRDMVKPIDGGAMSGIAGGIRDKVRMEWKWIRSADVEVEKAPRDMDDAPIVLEGYPLEEPLTGVPRLYGGEFVRGGVVGFKGKYAFLRSGGLIAFRMTSLVGRTIHTASPLEGD